MKFNQKEEENLPETYKRTRVFGLFGAAIGAGISAILTMNLWFIGIGAVIGSIASELIAILVRRKVSLHSLFHIEGKVNIFLGILSFLLFILGIVAFFRTQRFVFLLATLFFGFCGIVYFKKRFFSQN